MNRDEGTNAIGDYAAILFYDRDGDACGAMWQEGRGWIVETLDTVRRVYADRG